MHKKSFRKPIVRLSSDCVRFPNTCPVCGAPATCSVRISTRPRLTTHTGLDGNRVLAVYSMHRHEVIGPPSKVFVVPVCEEHQHSDEWEWRYRSVFACLTGISASALVFGTMAGFHEARLSGVLPLWYIALLMGFIFLLSGTMIAFGKKPIEKAIDFLGFTYDEKSVLVSIGNDTYRRLLLEQNPSAELVNWVVFL